MAVDPTMPDDQEFAGRAILLLTEMGHALTELLGGADVDAYVVRNTPMATLLLLRFEGPMRPSALSERVGMTTGGMTKVVDQLAERALVVRDAEVPDDGRAVMVDLTEKGRDVVDRVCALSEPVVREGVDRLRMLRAPSR